MNSVCLDDNNTINREMLKKINH